MYSAGKTALAPGTLTLPAELGSSAAVSDGAEQSFVPAADESLAGAGAAPVTAEQTSSYIDVPAERLVRNMREAYSAPVPIRSISPPSPPISPRVPPSRLPEPPPPSLWERIKGLFGWNQPLIMLSHEEFRLIAGQGNPFGISCDNKGNWFYPPEGKNQLMDSLGARRAILHQNGLIEFRVKGVPDPVILFPQASDVAWPAEPLRLNYTALKAAAPQKRPIVFYHEDSDPRFRDHFILTKPGVAQWVSAMRDLGFDIIYVGSLSELERVTREEKPEIVLVSAVENLLPYAQAAYHQTKGIDPSTLMVLGGIAAIPEFAQYYDVVVKGEAEIKLPLLLRHLQIAKVNGEIRGVKSVEWENAVAGLSHYLGAEGAEPGWFAEFARTTKFHPPVISRELAQMLSQLTATREWGDGGHGLSIAVPIAVDSNGKQQIFFRGLNELPRVLTVAQRYEDTVEAWKEKYGEHIPFPLSARAFARASRPDPISSDELDVLYIRFPSDGDANITKPFEWVSLYVQRGCRGDKRCLFCSMQQSADGRRASSDQVIRVMERAIAEGMTGFTFDDEQFLQSPRWRRELIDAIKAHGIHKRMRIYIQTRADMISEDALKDLMDINAEVSLGLETLNPRRADNLGKGTTKQGGEGYVKKAVETLRMIARTATPGNIEIANNIIAVGHGDRVVDIAADTLAQLELMTELWEDYGYELRFQFSKRQAPYYGDRITSYLAGFPDAQPGSINSQSSRRIGVGGINGMFHPFGIQSDPDSPGRYRATGIFQPLEFQWPEPIRSFLEPLKPFDHGLKIGDIRVGLHYAYEHSTEMNPAERAELGRLLEEIDAAYKKLRADAIMSRHVLSAEDRKADRDEVSELNENLANIRITF